MTKRILSVLAVATFVLGVGGFCLPAAADAVLKGAVKSSGGASLDGVVVSARHTGKTFTTTVFTDERGNYVFPAMQEGSYRVWAQAVGFETSRAELRLDGAPTVQKDFTLNTLEDFSKQLSGSEWIASLPETTPQEHRMKLLFRNNCAGCHTPNFVLQNRFDEAGWQKIITVMETVGIYGDPPQPDRTPQPLIHEYRDELAAYLAKVRGPGPSPIQQFKTYPRPRGEAARAVITEYDYTSSADTNQFVTHDGSDWMEGVPSAYEARGSHDAEVDQDGFVWIADAQTNRVRTVARLDPRTGEIRNFMLEGRYGAAQRSHGIVIDQKARAWFNSDNGLGMIDTKTMRMERFQPPQGMAGVGGTLDVNSDGVVCVSTNTGALGFDPETKQFKSFVSKTPGREGRTYGVAVDSLGNCWWAQMNFDKLGVGNLKTGEITELALEPVRGVESLLTDKDRRLFATITSDWNSATLLQQAPRRLSGDKKGNIWVANWWGNNVAKIDARTHKVTYYYYPHAGHFPGIYDTTVDKNGMVWMNLMDTDRVARFNPDTEQWTEFQLPSLGTETRFVAVDNHKTPVEVWVPYWRTHKVARIQFRTPEQLQGQR